MGFKDSVDFNKAMLGKQAWRMAKQPDALWCQVLKSIYFPQRDFWTASKGSRPSWGWQSLLMGREAIENATKWRVGNGEKIRIREDSWIPSGRPIGPANQNEPRVVAELINSEANEWDISRINELYDERVAQEILANPLSLSPQDDQLVWTTNTSGSYTVKSGYNQIHNRAACPTKSTPSSSYQAPKALWKEIWKLPTYPKIRFLLWNICSNAISTKENLYRRHIIPDPTCPVCGEAPETAEHLFLLCNSRTTPETKALFAGLLWKIWKTRNSVVFKGCVPDPKTIKEDAEIEAALLEVR